MKLLILSPSFHGYGESLGRGFAAAGCDVTTLHFDSLASVSEKVANKLLRELPERLTGTSQVVDDRASARTVEAVLSRRPDAVVVIKGDRLSARVNEAIEFVGARSVLWLYDEVRRTRHTEESLDRYPQLVSYSPIDAATFTAAGRACLYVPNAFDPTMQPTPRQTDRVLFIGARYRRREQLMLALARAGVPHLAVGREWSHHPFDRLRTWQWHRPRVDSSRDLHRIDGYALTAGAPAAINIHGDQDGFTMKTFEVPGVGGVQLVDRDEVAEFYEPGEEVLVFHDEDELIDLSRRLIADDRWGDRIRRAGQRRTLAEHTFEHRAREVLKLWA